MNLKRVKLLYHKIRFALIVDGVDRAEYVRKHNLFAYMGKECMFHSRNFPPNPKLVKIHDNVAIAAKVTLCTHDAIGHVMIRYDKDHKFVDHEGAIEIDEYSFIGLGSIILPNVHIGKNCIIGAGSLVAHDIPDGSIAAGVPARVIGTFDSLHQKRVEEGLRLKGRSYEEIEAIAWQDFYEQRNMKPTV